MTEVSVSADQNPASEKGVWEAPTVEELDLNTAEFRAGPVADGPYPS